MKRILFLLIVIFILSCKNSSQEDFEKSTIDKSKIISGEDLFSGKGTCTACHLPDQKVIGPSITEIAKIYKEQNASIVSFLKEETEPIVDPKMYETMKANFAITKQMSDDELKALEDYILTFAK
jgi:cytochrome c